MSHDVKTDEELATLHAENSFEQLTANAMKTDPPKRGSRSGRRKLREAKKKSIATEMVERLGKLQRSFTIVSAYLQCPDKNPSVFIEALESSLNSDTLKSKQPKTILKQLRQTWEQCVNNDKGLPFTSSAPHVFLSAINRQPDLWNAPLTLGNALQTSSSSPARLSCGG